MATEIDDSGSHGYDAPLTGTFTTDAANKVLEMGADGSADTGFTLPTDSDWLLVEVYDINGTAGHIGFTKWQADSLGNMGTDVDTVLSGYYTTINAEYGDSTNTFKAIATLFDTSASTATVMEADDTAGFDTVASPSYTVSSYTPPTGTWKITDTVVAPVAPSNLLEDIRINFLNSTMNSTALYTYNDMTRGSSAAVDLDDINGDAVSGATYQRDSSKTPQDGYGGPISTDNPPDLGSVDQMCAPDYESEDCWRTNTEDSGTYPLLHKLVLPVGWYTIKASAYTNSVGTNVQKEGKYILNYEDDTSTEIVKYIEAEDRNSPFESSDHCVTWQPVYSDGTTEILFSHRQREDNGYHSYINSLVISNVSAPSYGSELLDGGNNDNGALDATDWTAISGNAESASVLTVRSASALQCLSDDADSGHYQAFTTVSGKTYEMNATLIGCSNGTLDPAYEYNDSTYIEMSSSVPTAGDNSSVENKVCWYNDLNIQSEFTATGTTSYVAVKCTTVNMGGNVRSISIKQKD